MARSVNRRLSAHARRPHGYEPLAADCDVSPPPLLARGEQHTKAGCAGSQWSAAIDARAAPPQSSPMAPQPRIPVNCASRGALSSKSLTDITKCTAKRVVQPNKILGAGDSTLIRVAL